MARSFWRGSEPLLLASGSSIRATMLSAAGVPVEVLKADIDERALEAPLRQQSAAGETVALALARAKALQVSNLKPGRFVLGADQTLTCDQRQLHKAESLDDAKRQLAALAGRSHQLHSAFALVHNGAVCCAGVQSARLTMRALSSAFITAYIDLAGPAILGSVGCYQLESVGAQLFATIDGDHFTILGLPLLLVLDALRDQNLIMS